MPLVRGSSRPRADPETLRPYLGSMTHSPETSGRLDERLVQAGTGPDKEIDHLVQAVGLDAVVSALVAEIIFRCDAPVNTKPTNIALDITHRDDRRTVVLRVHRDTPI